MEFEQFYEASYAHIYRSVCLAVGENIAADVTQEAFEKAFARWRRLQDEPWAEGWVMTTALNIARRSIRRKRRELAIGYLPQRSLDAPTGDKVDLLAALRELPFRQKQAIILFYWGGFPGAAVAHLMGLSEGAVRAHLSLGREALRRKLEVHDVRVR